VIAREGYRGASVRQLADAVGLSQAGLLHYFDSKEELFTEILRKRDEVDAARFSADPSAIEQPDAVRSGYLAVIRHNAEVPGLVQLFSRLAVDAGDPEHPAHHFFLERGETLRSIFAHAFRRMQADGGLSKDIDPEVLARIFQAVADGLQLQWMQDPSLDMAGTVEALFRALEVPDTQSAETGNQAAGPGTPDSAHAHLESLDTAKQEEQDTTAQQNEELADADSK